MVIGWDAIYLATIDFDMAKRRYTSGRIFKK